MMHGSEWTLQYDEPEVENVTQWATFSTEGHHISNVTRTTMLHLFCRMTNHTHPFNGPFSRTTQVGRYQKGKTNPDFTEARDSEWQWHQLGLCKSAPRSRQITTPAPHHSVFHRPDALPAAQPTASKH